MTGKKIAFVPLRYGESIVGGSEAVMRSTAQGFADRGWEVDVVTSCIDDLHTMEQRTRPGNTREGDINVYRYGAIHSSRKTEKYQYDRRIIAGDRLSFDEQIDWINSWFRIPDLFDHLVARADEYQAIVFSPYLFWHTLVGSQAAPERSIIMPCFHDESYAKLDMFKVMMQKVASAWFLSEPEQELAGRLGALPEHCAQTGIGVDAPAESAYDPEGFVKKHNLKKPFLVYAGRREAGKGWNDMLATFIDARRRGLIDLDLVSFGSHPISVPGDVADHVHDLGFLPRAEVHSAFSAAVAYVQPSVNESFSLSVMEAWLAGTPVIATSDGAVVRWHCERSNAGLTYRNPDELIEAMRFVEAHPKQARELASPGRTYVLEQYNWEAVLDRMETDVAAIGPVATAQAAAPAASTKPPSVLVVAPYPPMVGEAAKAAVQTVRELHAIGAKVTVLSPQRSAAHRHGPLQGVRGLTELLKRVRRYDQVVVQMDVRMFLQPAAGRIRRTLDCMALAGVLKLAKHAELRFVDLAVIPKAVGGRAARLLWDSAEALVVPSEHDRGTLQQAGGVDPSRIRVQTNPEPITQRAIESDEPNLDQVTPLGSWDELDIAATRDEIQSQIGARGAQARKTSGT